LRFGLFGLAAVVVCGFAVMALWNWLMPVVFGWRPISFGQALGLLLLSRVLFGGFRGGGGAHMHWRHRMRQRWEQMTPEERTRFREGMGGCGHPGPTEGAPTA
jgi:hypothetical protein